MNFGTERVERLLRETGNPDKRFKFIHIAGTNGKGTVTRALSALLTSCGIPHGIFMSPFLMDPRDSIQVTTTTDNPFEPPQPICISLYNNLLNTLNQRNSESQINATEFEVSTVLAAHAFAHSSTKFAIVECGLGGAYDATNGLWPGSKVLGIVTAIQNDHLAFLGPTLEHVARHKLGIVTTAVCLDDQSEKCFCVPLLTLPEQRDWFKTLLPDSFDLLVDNSAGLNVPTFEGLKKTEKMVTAQFRLRKGVEFVGSLLGPVEPLRKNFSLAFDAFEYLLARNIINSDCESKSAPLEDVKFMSRFGNVFSHPGRCCLIPLPTLRHNILVDGCHNPDSIESFCTWYKNVFSPALKNKYRRRLNVILSFSKGNPEEALPLFKQFAKCFKERAKIWIVPFSLPVGMGHVKCTDPLSLLELAGPELASGCCVGSDFGSVFEEIAERFLSEGKENYEEGEEKEALTVVAGSLYLISDVYRYVEGIKKLE